MKKIIILLVSVFAMNTFSTFATNNATAVATQTDSNWHTCQFSLSSYSGVIRFNENDGYCTQDFQVLLNCPQQSDISATVYLNIDGECVASKVVTIKAGKTASILVRIKVDNRYSGKEYTLKV